MDWYRAYHGMPQDAKLKVVAHRTKQPMASVVAVWVHLLDMASQNNPRGNVVRDEKCTPTGFWRQKKPVNNLGGG
jgi:hypothetical protein